MTDKSVRSAERILLLDSVPPVESVLTSELNSLGYRVDTACDLSQATRLAESRPHDLVLIADAVPREIAADLCERVRSRQAEAPPILLMTPLDAIESQADRTSRRADDFLVTPYTETEVQIRVRAMLQARAERDALRAKVEELRRSIENEGERLAQDDLTKLPNRQYLEDFATRELIRAERYERMLSLVKVGLDNMQGVSEAHGDDAGDEVLREIAALFKQSVRCVDFAARYDGDGFAIVFPETDKSGAVVAAERVRECIEGLRLSSPDGRPIPNVTASLGVATFPEDAPDLPRLMSIADLRLGIAKLQGRNRVAVGHAS